MIPSVDALIAFSGTLQGEQLHTLARKKEFRVHIVGCNLEFAPDSSADQTRPESREKIAAVLSRLEKTGSFQMSDYRDLSWNASYVLALVRYWQSAQA